MKQAIIYSLKVWLITVFLSSLISMMIQTFILLPHYHLSRTLNHYYDLLLQLVGTGFVNAILLLPMGIILLAVAMMYRKRNVRLKTGLYVTVITFCMIPNLGLMCYEIKNSEFTLTSASGIGMMLNILTCTTIAVVCVERFKLNKSFDLRQRDISD